MINKFFKTNFSLLLILFLLFTGDTLTGIFLKDNYNYSWLFKGVISIILLVNLVLSNKKLFYKLTILFFIFSFGMIFNYLNDFISKISLFFEYISGLLFFNFLLINNNKEILKTALFYIFSFYLITILFAALFDLDYLKTYGENRFGYKPIFSSQNEFSFIMIAILAYFFKKYLDKNSILNFSLFIFSIFVALLVGTKVVYLFVFIFINYLTLKYLKIRYYLLLVFLIAFISFLIKDVLFNLIQQHFKAIADVYLNTGFIDAVSSLRLSFLKDRILCQLSSFKFINYFSGGLNMDCSTEMSIIDIFLFFGVIGLPFYFYLYKKEVYDKLNLDHFGFVLVLSIICLSFLGGYFFENLSAQAYVLIVLFIYYYNPSLPYQNIEVK